MRGGSRRERSGIGRATAVMVAAFQRMPSTEGTSQRPTHAGVSVGLVRKERRGKSPLTLDVALDKLERMCISSAGRHSMRRSYEKAEWLAGSNSPSAILARRRNRAGFNTLQSIDLPIIVVDSVEDSAVPQAPRSGASKWGYLSSAVKPMASVPSSVSSYHRQLRSCQCSSGSGSSQEGASLFLSVNDASPTPSP